MSVTFAIKVDFLATGVRGFAFTAQKTMYGGKFIAQGDVIYIFERGTCGGRGLWGRGRVSSAESAPNRRELARQTPRVSITVDGLERAAASLGKMDLKDFKHWRDGKPQTELNFKFYRQATNKIVGLSPVATVFLESFFLHESAPG